MASLESLFPSLILIPMNSANAQLYEGYISIHRRDYFIRLWHDCTSGQVQMEAELNLQREILASNFKAPSQCRNILDFITTLKTHLEQTAIVSYDWMKLTNDNYLRILEELNQIQWKNLVSIDDRLQSAQFVIPDSQNRRHELTLLFPSNYPTEAPKVNHSLPEEFSFNWKKEGRLELVLAKFEEKLEKFEEFWRQMDLIQQNSWCIEPEKPSLKDVHRRILIGSNVALWIQLDPYHPRDIPKWNFFGPSAAVKKYSTLFASKINSWDFTRDLIDNLQLVLDMEFPRPNPETKQSAVVECGICYSAYFNGKPPEVVCENASCGQFFHQECLAEWLRSVTTSCQSFDMLTGQCPYCSQTIQMKTT